MPVDNPNGGKLGDDKQSTPPENGVGLSENLIKSLRQKNANKNGSEGGSSSSNNGNGNNSDNSALVSIGNTSFGFNFDSEEGNSSPRNSEERNTESDSEGNSNINEAKSISDISRETGLTQQEKPDAESNESLGTPSETTPTDDSEPQNSSNPKKQTSSSFSQNLDSSTASNNGTADSNHSMAADAAVANLHSIASAYIRKDDNSKSLTAESGSLKVKAESESNGGYNTDDEGARGFKRGGDAVAEDPDPEPAPSSLATSNVGFQVDTASSNFDDNTDERPKKKKKANDKKREERNAREKERSFRISKQINELRNLLSSGGVIVPKGTKSSVLTEAANYIRMLQQHQYRSEIDRHQLVQQIQMIGGGAHGPKAAQAIRHVAAKNGVWSLGNFGGVPPKSAMSYFEPGSNEEGNGMQLPLDPIKQTRIEEHEYRSVFNNCAVGMAIASMGGAFIDCNHLFCQLSNYSKQEVCSLTIFNLTARQDLQHAFDLISQLISPPMDVPNSVAQQPIVLRGSMNNRSDLGLGVALVKGEDGIAKFFCVTLIKNPASPFDESKPIPATIELIQGTPTMTKSGKDGSGLDSSPAFTTG